MTNVAKKEREMIFVGVTASIVRETEKAYQVEVQYWTKADQPVKKAKMWVPKSCSKVEDGKVTQIADFILRQWEQEHLEYIKSFSSLTASHTRIDYDIARKEELVRREKEKQAAYKKHIDDIIAKYLPTVTESSHKMLAELGTIAQAFGRIWKEEGTDAITCDEFVAWGKDVCKKYGELEPTDEYYEKAKKFDEKDRRFVVGYIYDTWVFGDFRADYYGKEKDFYEVKDYLIQKKFKKECDLGHQYMAFVEKLYKLNGERY